MYRPLFTALSFTLLIAAAGICADTQPSQQADPVIWIAMNGPLKLKKIAPGSELHGRLWRGLYWRKVEVLPQGSEVRLVVDEVKLRRKFFAADDRPFLIHLFAPRHEVTASFRSVSIVMPRGAEVPLRAKFIALSQRAVLKAEVK